MRVPFGACVSVPPGALAPRARVRVTLALCDDAPVLATGGAAKARWLAAGPAVTLVFASEPDADGRAASPDADNAAAACARAAVSRVPHGAHMATSSRLRLFSRVDVAAASADDPTRAPPPLRDGESAWRARLRGVVTLDESSATCALERAAARAAVACTAIGVEAIAALRGTTTRGDGDERSGTSQPRRSPARQPATTPRATLARRSRTHRARAAPAALRPLGGAVVGVGAIAASRGTTTRGDGNAPGPSSAAALACAPSADYTARGVDGVDTPLADTPRSRRARGLATARRRCDWRRGDRRLARQDDARRR